ncbi:MAG: ribonuclease III domain-containing protein [Bacilli bacterium]
MKDKNVLLLAYIGDAIYEICIREYLINKNIIKVNLLQKSAIKYVCASSQKKYLELLINKNFFNEVELEIIYRARNHKGGRHPKNTDIITYKYSTAFEAVIGYLYLEKNIERLNKLMEYIYEKTI